MLILDDRTLAAAGLDFATARALLKPPDEELIVHITRCDGPPLPLSELVMAEATENDDGGVVLPLTHEGDRRPVDAVPTIAPPTPPAEVGLATGHRLRSDFRDHASAATYQGATPLGSTSAHPMPEQIGLTFTALADAAQRRRMTLLFQSGMYCLLSPLGQRYFHDLRQVHGALRYGTGL